jgi:hypothetical protein
MNGPISAPAAYTVFRQQQVGAFYWPVPSFEIKIFTAAAHK